jgi:hypothetical protein
MEQLRERVIRLEERQIAEQQRVNYFLACLDKRLERLEPRPPVSGPSLKLLLAAGLALLVFMLTGDPRAALRVGLGGMP